MKHTKSNIATGKDLYGRYVYDTTQKYPGIYSYTFNSDINNVLVTKWSIKDSWRIYEYRSKLFYGFYLLNKESQ